MTSAFIIATLGVVVYSLWVRRDTWWSRWESAASLTIALEGVALVLLSPWASAELGPLCYRAVHLWNVPNLLGVLALASALAANIEHALLRLADPDQVHVLLRRQVLRPSRIVAAALVVSFVLADVGYHPNLFAAPVNSVWQALYWLLTCGLVIYLSGYSGRVVLLLRGDPRAKTTVDLCVIAAGFGTATCLLVLVGAMTRTDLAVPIWACACLAVGVYAYGSARSWKAKAAWFTSGNQPPTQTTSA